MSRKKKGRAEVAHADNGLASRLPFYFVFVLCALYALQLGIDRPWFSFQKSPLQEVLHYGCNATPYFTYAFAAGNEILLPAMQSEKTGLSAVLEGSGSAESFEVDAGDADLAFAALQINGKEACSPCEEGIRYPLAQPLEGRLVVEATVEGANRSDRGEADLALPQAFFTDRRKSSIETPLLLRVHGGWQASPNRQVPSSFYGVDAPFHIGRVPLLAKYLGSLGWPSSGYPFLSVLPPALFYMAAGLPHQYAFKAWEILLFFVPVGIFFAFSRKLAKGGNGAFVFSSLLYLYLPANGLPIGGGPDLFFYGMVAHTLGTYLSLLFFYFAYCFSLEGRRRELLLAILFFALAFFSNPRIILPLSMGLGLLCALTASQGRWRRAAVLGLGCAASVAWFAIPYAQSFSLVSYGPLEGVAVESYWQGVLALLQAGFVVLPALFLAGVAAAWKRRELLPLAVGGWGTAVLLLAASPEINRLLPAVDGLRFLPSFFLPAFFVAGIGANAAWGWMARAARRAAARLGMDGDTFAVALGLALLLPLAAAAGAVMLSTMQQYREAGDSLAAAYDFESQSAAYRMAGNERVLFVSYGEVSQYPVLGERVQDTGLAGFGSPKELASLMREQRLRFAILGNSRMAPDGEKTKLEEYREMESSPLFSQLLPYGGARLFALKGGETGERAFADGAEGFWHELKYDSARLGGNCVSENCSALAFVRLGEPVGCAASSGGCSARVGEKSGGILVDEIPKGPFEVALSPGSFGYEGWLRLLCGIALLACVIYAGRN